MSDHHCDLVVELAHNAAKKGISFSELYRRSKTYRFHLLTIHSLVPTMKRLGVLTEAQTVEDVTNEMLVKLSEGIMSSWTGEHITIREGDIENKGKHFKIDEITRMRTFFTTIQRSSDENAKKLMTLSPFAHRSLRFDAERGDWKRLQEWAGDYDEGFHRTRQAYNVVPGLLKELPDADSNDEHFIQETIEFARDIYSEYLRIPRDECVFVYSIQKEADTINYPVLDGLAKDLLDYFRNEDIEKLRKVLPGFSHASEEGIHVWGLLKDDWEFDDKTPVKWNPPQDREPTLYGWDIDNQVDRISVYVRKTGWQKWALMTMLNETNKMGDADLFPSSPIVDLSK